MAENYEFIYDLIKSSTAIVDEVGDRIYHGNIPETEDSLPTINYFMVSRPNVALGAADRERWQISSRAVSPAIAMNMAKEVKSAFNEIQDSIGGFDVQNTHFEGETFLREPDNTYHVPVDVFILYIN